jgi:exodeoxyribonuclease VII small subunit
VTFEEDLDRLERIVRELERDQVSLDDALRLFEEGVARLRAAEAALRDAEAKVARLVEREDGTFDTAPADG